MAELSADDAVRFLSALSVNRRTAKRLLHDLGLSATSDDIDDTHAEIQRRPDYKALVKRAEQSQVVAEPSVHKFDPLNELRRALIRRGETVDQFVHRLERNYRMDAKFVREFLEGKTDPLLSEVVPILSAAGAINIYFERPRTREAE